MLKSDDITIIWASKTALYANGYTGRLGKYVIFSIDWDSGGRDKENMHKLTCALPGLKSKLGNFKSPDDAYAYALNALKLWMKGAGLSE